MHTDVVSGVKDLGGAPRARVSSHRALQHDHQTTAKFKALTLITFDILASSYTVTLFTSSMITIQLFITISLYFFTKCLVTNLEQICQFQTKH